MYLLRRRSALPLDPPGPPVCVSWTPPGAPEPLDSEERSTAPSLRAPEDNQSTASA